MKRECKTGDWGSPPNGVQMQRPLKLNAFLHYHNSRNQTICHEICFLRNKKLRRTFGSHCPGRCGSASAGNYKKKDNIRDAPVRNCLQTFMFPLQSNFTFCWCFVKVLRAVRKSRLKACILQKPGISCQISPPGTTATVLRARKTRNVRSAERLPSGKAIVMYLIHGHRRKTTQQV